MICKRCGLDPLLADQLAAIRARLFLAEKVVSAARKWSWCSNEENQIAVVRSLDEYDAALAAATQTKDEK